MKDQLLHRTIHPQVRIADESKGIVEYIASDESVDSYREVIRADGWRFNRFQKNAPFLDSHRYDGIQNLLGKVISFSVQGRKLVEAVQWAIDVPENQLARIGWAMTQAGYLRAVSVGFAPVRWVSKWNRDKTMDWVEQLKDLNLTEDQVELVHLEQEQMELSACVVGANPNAVARCYKAGTIADPDLEFLSRHSSVQNAARTDDPALVQVAHERAREEFLRKFEAALKKL